MNNADLAARKQRLLIRSALLRQTLGDQAQVLKRPLALIDQVQTRLQWLARNPKWPVAALMVLLILRPRRTLVWSGRIWRLWKLFKRSKNWIDKLPLQQHAP